MGKPTVPATDKKEVTASITKSASTKSEAKKKSKPAIIEQPYTFDEMLAYSKTMEYRTKC